MTNPLKTLLESEQTTPIIMGVVNATPDSYYTCNRSDNQLDRAIEIALDLEAQGADIIDVGGESTNPKAKPISEAEEFQRVVPLLTELVKVIKAPLSVDTSRASIMQEALKLGVNLINDVRGLRWPGTLEAVAAYPDAMVCLMHMQDIDGDIKENHYSDAQMLSHLVDFFASQLERLAKAGVSSDNVIIDPGFGAGSFGKTVSQHVALLAHLDTFTQFGCPILVGLSRKSFIGELFDCEVGERLPASLTAASVAYEKGARIFRVHDVAATKQALMMTHLIKEKERVE